LSRTHRAQKQFVSLCRWKVSSADAGAKPNAKGSTLATVFTVEGEISRGRSSHVGRIVQTTTTAKVMPPPPGNRSTSHNKRVQIYFNLAFLFCPVVIKWPDEDISDYERISRSANRPLAPVRGILSAGSRRMR
jgi:hypothetical protein